MLLRAQILLTAESFTGCVECALLGHHILVGNIAPLLRLGVSCLVCCQIVLQTFQNAIDLAGDGDGVGVGARAGAGAGI